MSKDFVKVRKVAGSMVISIPQLILSKASISEGDRVLIEALAPNRIVITRIDDGAVWDGDMRRLDAAQLEKLMQFMEKFMPIREKHKGKRKPPRKTSDGFGKKFEGAI